MNAHFKKKGGGDFDASELIKLSFDEQRELAAKPDLETFEKLAAKHGKRKPRKKKDGK